MCSLRARADNPEAHVARIRALLDRHRARNLVVDPLSALTSYANQTLGDRAAVQVLDVAKSLGITTVSTSLLANAAPLSEQTPLGISTIADTWMHVSYVSSAGERNRALTIIKSRGTSHSNQVRELVLDDHGVSLADPYISGGEVLMGTLRWEREAEDKRLKELAVTESHLQQKHAELAVAESRLRIEAAATERALREADLQRVLSARATATEFERVETLGRASRRGGEGLLAPVSTRALARDPGRGCRNCTDAPDTLDAHLPHCVPESGVARHDCAHLDAHEGGVLRTSVARQVAVAESRLARERQGALRSRGDLHQPRARVVGPDGVRRR
jgi:hypothetical protein